MAHTYNYERYEDMVTDPAWRKRLLSLNKALAKTMHGMDELPSLNGNLFYAHKDLEFIEGELLERFEVKRKNFFQLAKHISSLLEVGVNGGHSLFLALSANPSLKVVGIDVCEPLDPSWAPVHKYVPAAFRWLKKEFPGRCTFIKGNSLVELPKFALKNETTVVDAVHLDGAKDTHLRELLAILPLMNEDGYVVFDDANTKPVRKGIDQVKKLNIARPRDLSHMGIERTPGHRVFPILNAGG
ncbi:class I SAM-dependent methyltransferase [Yoonia maritima]|uniref:class I SAM-dependent methyltransferase n=1 Tax=Yoonia maritima TaxID=1435347 RepID=UPI0013A62ADA|nr:class I SAM-dependent methyltransferase [Yoonia maritima]